MKTISKNSKVLILISIMTIALNIKRKTEYVVPE